MRPALSHVSPSGDIRMVDVSEKESTARVAVARGRLVTTAAHRAAIGALPKGDALLTAKVAGIQGGKRTAELIPLCHPVALTHLDVQIDLVGDSIEIVATAKTSAQTGVEMEAYTAVVIAGVTLIDMLKGVDPDLTLTDVQLLEKTGGKSRWGRVP